MKYLTISLFLITSSLLGSSNSITVAIPDFANVTNSQTTRIEPGKYKEKNVKIGTNSRDEKFEENGKTVQTRETRDQYEKQLERTIEYAPGEWILPDKAGTVAADALAGRLIEAKLRVLSRNTQTLKTREEERMFSTMLTSPNQLINFYRDANANFVIIGRIVNFRIEETEGIAYGVKLQRLETRVSGDIQVIDVATGEIAAQQQFNEVVRQNIPDGMKTSTFYEWETPLRIAIEQTAPSLINQILRDETPMSQVAETIQVDIKSDPAGADILINGLFVGNTPSTIPVEKGRCEITIEKQGYQSWSRTVKVHNELKIDASLSKLPETKKADKQDKPEAE